MGYLDAAKVKLLEGLSEALLGSPFNLPASMAADVAMWLAYRTRKTWDQEVDYLLGITKSKILARKIIARWFPVGHPVYRTRNYSRLFRNEREWP